MQRPTHGASTLSFGPTSYCAARACTARAARHCLCCPTPPACSPTPPPATVHVRPPRCAPPALTCHCARAPALLRPARPHVPHCVCAPRCAPRAPQVYIPELCATYRCHPRFRLFAAQNPVQEGGGRKGLPRSFLNRFTRVHAEPLGPVDLAAISASLHPALPRPTLARMIALLERMGAAAAGEPAHAQPLAAGGSSGGGGGGAGGGGGGAGGGGAGGGAGRFAALGGPWEFNLRDLLRWAALTEGALQGVQQQQLLQQHEQQQRQAGCPPAHDGSSACVSSPSGDTSTALEAAADAAAEHYAHMLFAHRLRSPGDRAAFAGLFAAAWGRPLAPRTRVPVLVSPGAACVGRACVPRLGAAAAGAGGAAGTSAGGGGGGGGGGAAGELEAWELLPHSAAGGVAEVQQEVRGGTRCSGECSVVESMMRTCSKALMLLPERCCPRATPPLPTHRTCTCWTGSCRCWSPCARPCHTGGWCCW